MHIVGLKSESVIVEIKSESVDRFAVCTGYSPQEVGSVEDAPFIPPTYVSAVFFAACKALTEKNKPTIFTLSNPEKKALIHRSESYRYLNKFHVNDFVQVRSEIVSFIPAKKDSSFDIVRFVTSISDADFTELVNMQTKILLV